MGEDIKRNDEAREIENKIKKGRNEKKKEIMEQREKRTEAGDGKRITTEKKLKQNEINTERRKETLGEDNMIQK